MYRIQSFSNAHEYQELFGVQEHGNGVKSRKNKILLALLKSKEVWAWCRENEDWKLLGIKSMAELKKVLNETIAYDGIEHGLHYKVTLNGTTYRSNVYETDSYEGIPEDGTSGYVRYINHSNNSGVFKMRAGKFYGKIINETTIGQALPQQVKTWLSEEFAADWQVFCAGTLPEFELHVDEDFERIYSSNHLSGNFGSCMVDRDFHSFYSDSVKAKAAYLTNAENKIIARCVIFSEVHDEDDKVWRLAERQYSTDGNASTGGLYEDIPTNQMVPVFNNWCFDKNRKAGDSTIVLSEFGYHIMYFEGTTENPVWHKLADSVLSADESDSSLTNITEKAGLKSSFLGSRYFVKDTELN